MVRPRIHILYEFTDKPFGGANQFLKALKKEFERKGCYSENMEGSSCILFNSHTMGEGGWVFNDVLALKRKYPDKLFIHRVDGPLSIYQRSNPSVDRLIYRLNEMIVDGTVFQSSWSKEHNKELGMKTGKYCKTIVNSPDPSLFNPDGKTSYRSGRRIKLVATSWSPNPMKGFDIYKYLDANLDFKRYDMSFIGRAPTRFSNIRNLGPKTSGELAKELKKNDIFITASRKESCPNSVLEALHCGLPVVALDDGGHPEIVGKMGELFSGETDVLKKIDRVADRYVEYKKRIEPKTLDDVSEMYIDLIRQVHDDVDRGSYSPKKIGMIDVVTFRVRFGITRIRNFIIQ